MMQKLIALIIVRSKIVPTTKYPIINHDNSNITETKDININNV
ncbi:hypothetical protein [Romboutsia sp. MSSM.1001216sp_RTP31141st1_F12_RTP31141_220114]